MISFSIFFSINSFFVYQECIKQFYASRAWTRQCCTYVLSNLSRPYRTPRKRPVKHGQSWSPIPAENPGYLAPLVLKMFDDV